MMTNEEILELVRFHFEEGGIRDDGSCSEYFGTPKDFIEFAQAIRRDTLYEVIHILSSVPNPEANRTAINRITMELD
jgi:hypothetical protein